MQMQEKLEQDRRRREDLEHKEEEARKKLTRERMIEQAYRADSRDKFRSRSKGNARQKSRDKESKRRQPGADKRRPHRSESDSEEEDSLEMSDLENIRKQINKLEDRIEAESKKK